MKLTINNLGAVVESSIEIKPLTVFVGPNNTGKTWTAYTIGAIFGPFGWDNYLEKISENELQKLYPILNNHIEELIQNKSVKIDIINLFSICGEFYFNQVSKSANNWIPKFLCTKKLTFENLSFDVSLSNQHKQQINNQLKDLELKKNIKK